MLRYPTVFEKLASDATLMQLAACHAHGLLKDFFFHVRRLIVVMPVSNFQLSTRQTAYEHRKRDRICW